MTNEYETPPMIDENGNAIERAGGPGQALAKRNATTEIASSRAAQEVQAAMVVAKRFPRDVTAAVTRIMETCRRKAVPGFASGLEQAEVMAFRIEGFDDGFPPSAG